MNSFPKTILFFILLTTLTFSLKHRQQGGFAQSPATQTTPITDNNKKVNNDGQQTNTQSPVITPMTEKSQEKKQQIIHTNKQDAQEKKTQDNLKSQQNSDESQEQSQEESTLSSSGDQSEEQTKAQKKKNNLQKHKIMKKNKNNEKSISQRQESEEQSSSEQQQDVQQESKPIRSHSMATDTEKKPVQPYKTSVILFVCLYGIIVLAILILIKVKAQQSHAANMIDALLEMTIYRAMQYYFTKKNGYEASAMNEEIVEDIDRGDSVAIGYSGQQGRELFWERNSATGI